jgi:hypothetical protein
MATRKMFTAKTGTGFFLNMEPGIIDSGLGASLSDPAVTGTTEQKRKGVLDNNV